MNQINLSYNTILEQGHNEIVYSLVRFISPVYNPKTKWLLYAATYVRQKERNI